MLFLILLVCIVAIGILVSIMLHIRGNSGKRWPQRQENSEDEEE